MQEEYEENKSNAPKTFTILKKHFSVIAFIIGLIAVVINYHFIKDNEDNFLSNFILLYLVLGFIISLYPTSYWWKNAIAAGSSMPVANIILIIIDSITMRLEHNLFPIELFMSASIGIGCSLFGAFVFLLFKEIFYSVAEIFSKKKG